tara:strand:- start:495 stop:731 length:237 start_codon:yes stop_codon:yes gene_type:complete
MINEGEVWERIDAIGRELVEEEQKMTNDDFAVAIASYCIGSLYAYCSISQADIVVKESRRKAIDSLSSNLDFDEIAQS